MPERDPSHRRSSLCLSDQSYSPPIASAWRELQAHLLLPLVLRSAGSIPCAALGVLPGPTWRKLIHHYRHMCRRLGLWRIRCPCEIFLVCSFTTSLKLFGCLGLPFVSIDIINVHMIRSDSDNKRICMRVSLYGGVEEKKKPGGLTILTMETGVCFTPLAIQ
jgi:hypothetical protein